MNRTLLRLRRRRPAPARLEPERTLRRTAIHEAAHAVVGIRLSLPLRDVALWPPEAPDSAGVAWLVPAEVDSWIAGLPEAWAVERLEALAAFQAAGVVAEVQAGSRVTFARGRVAREGGPCDGDAGELVKLAYLVDAPSLSRFWNASTAAATELLFMDGGRAWDRVATALLEAPSRCLPYPYLRSLVGPARSRRRLWDPPALEGLFLAPGLETLAPAGAGALTE